jgi:hypothetical protein
MIAMSDDARTWTEEDARMVAEALHCAETGTAGHWPTAAGWLAVEIDRLRAENAALRRAGGELVAAIVDQIGPNALTDERLMWRAVRGER